MTSWPFRVCIGYDQREHDAYVVCRSSLLRHSSIPLFINRLDIRNLEQAGLYTRPYKTENGQMVDERDGRPFSTEFAFSRFLVPLLAMYDGWSLFCDSDFLFTADIAELLPLIDNKYAVMVVKHQYIPTETVKMDGVRQAAYPRKNWSSFILWNNAHPSNKRLNLANVNNNSGRSLHGFEWLADEEIGEIPLTWNWLSGISMPLEEIPKAIHFTLGIPTMPGYENSPYADLWGDELTIAAEGNIL